MKKFALTLLAVGMTAMMVTGCNKNKKNNQKVTVNFYLAYNEITSKEVYYSYEVKNGSKLKEPERPEKGTFPEFPVFKGWSHKEIIDNDADLWDFSKDKVQVDEGISTFIMVGIWVAEGE